MNLFQGNVGLSAYGCRSYVTNCGTTTHWAQVISKGILGCYVYTADIMQLLRNLNLKLIWGISIR